MLSLPILAECTYVEVLWGLVVQSLCLSEPGAPEMSFVCFVYVFLL